MKYFTYELWCKMNSDDKKERDHANKQWDINSNEYLSIFEELKTKLPADFIKAYYRYYGFHDCTLRDINITHSKKSKKIPPTVSLICENYYKENDFFEINYKGVKKIEIKYLFDKDNMIFSKLGIDSFGYSEFNVIDQRTFSHEILFSSGMTILIHFEKIGVKKIN